MKTTMDLSSGLPKIPVCKISLSYDDRYYIEFHGPYRLTHHRQTHAQTTAGISGETYTSLTVNRRDQKRVFFNIFPFSSIMKCMKTDTVMVTVVTAMGTEMGTVVTSREKKWTKETRDIMDVVTVSQCPIQVMEALFFLVFHEPWSKNLQPWALGW